MPNTEPVNVWLPMFWNVALCALLGLPVACEPKLNEGGCDSLISTTVPAKVFAMKTSPAPSVVMPSGLVPVNTVNWAPPPAGTSTMRLFPI